MKKHSVGVVAIIVKKRSLTAPQVNDVLTQFGDIIVGRMGLPHHLKDLNIITLIVDATTDEIGELYRDRGVSVISIIVDGTGDDISALTGQLGRISHVSVKTALAKETGSAREAS